MLPNSAACLIWKLATSLNCICISFYMFCSLGTDISLEIFTSCRIHWMDSHLKKTTTTFTPFLLISFSKNQCSNTKLSGFFFSSQIQILLHPWKVATMKKKVRKILEIWQIAYNSVVCESINWCIQDHCGAF